MFCDCASDYFAAPPNTRVCAVCLGMPGVLPVINRHAVDLTIRSGLAFGCTVPQHSKFDRKNYPYPDLMKGYQISQYDEPLCVGGAVRIEVGGGEREIQLERIHLEEDTARLLHRDDEGGYSLLDVNRSGVPLMRSSPRRTCTRPRRPSPTCASCDRRCATLRCPTPTWRRARSAPTPTSRSDAPAPNSARRSRSRT